MSAGEEALRMHDMLMRAALGYPEAYEENPWGERVVKVRGKIFMFSSHDRLTVKLPQSGAEVLTRPYATPTGYGLGKSGWVTIRLTDELKIDELRGWIDESFRTVAPKRLSKTLDGLPPLASPAATAAPAPEIIGRAVLVGSDEKRLERARAALAPLGLDTLEAGEPVPEVLAAIARTRPDVVVIDLGRTAPHAFEFARYLVDDLHGRVRIAFAGARDAATEEKAGTFHHAVILASRLPPGDPAFAEAVATLVAKPE